MKVHAYFLCYNEEKILPHLLNYYLKFCSKVTILDNESTDSSVELINSYPNTEVISWNSNNEIRDDLYLQIKNNIWKRSRGSCDYVIVGDADEFIYHEDMTQFLNTAKNDGITIFKPVGYHMIADEDYTLSKNSNIIKEVTLGIRGQSNDKLMIFDPQLEEINYNPGCHTASPRGNVKAYISNGDLKMLHYKYLGLQDFIPKHLMRGKRLSSFNKSYNMGMYYLYDENTHRKEYSNFITKREKVL